MKRLRGENGPAKKVTLPWQKGDPPSRVTLLAESTFCFSSCKRFATFCKEMRQKNVGSPRVARVGGWPFYSGQLFSTQTGCKEYLPYLSSICQKKSFIHHRWTSKFETTAHLAAAPLLVFTVSSHWGPSDVCRWMMLILVKIEVCTKTLRCFGSFDKTFTSAVLFYHWNNPFTCKLLL